MTLHRCAIILIIFLSPLINVIFGLPKPFNYSCKLSKPPRNDATFPSFSNIKSLKFVVSHRISHELTTRAFAMFLKEIMDFDKPIILDTYEEDHWTTALYENKKYYDDDKTIDLYNFYELMDEEPAINLGVWQTGEHRDFLHQYIQEGNSISSDVFRHGLYVLEHLMQNKNEKISYKNFIANEGSYKKTINTFNLKNEDHLRAFLDSTLPISLENINHINVTNGIYRPTQCKSTTEPCGIVLTSHYIDNYFFIRIIEALKLKLEIYFMGDKLKRTISNLSKIIEINNIKRNFLVLHWTPSEIIDGKKKFSAIEMPPCELYRGLNVNISCKFDVNTVTVMYSKQLLEDSPFLAEILNKIRFKTLKPLLQKYDENFLKEKIDVLLTIKGEKYSHVGAHNETNLENIYNQIACEYMQKEYYYLDENEDDRWFTYPDEMTILIGGMYPKDNSGQEYDGIQTALQMAQEDLENLTELEGFPKEIKVKAQNNKIDCKPDETLRSFIGHFSEKSRMIGVSGPACSEAIEPIAIVSKHYKMTAITYSAEGISFADRTNYPYFFRTIGENTQYEDVFAKLFERLRWERIAAITEDGQKWTEYITRMESSNNSKFKIIVNRKFSREANEKKQLEHFYKLLKELKEINRARIIICDIHDHLLMKPIMCTASKLGMTAKEGYVWFLPVYISLKMNETNSLYSNETCSMSKILDGHFALSYANLGKDEEKIPSKITVEGWKESYMHKTNKSEISPADYAPFVYDTIWVYVKTLKKLMNADPPANETTRHWYLKNLDNKVTYDKISEIIENLNFTGVSGKIEFNKAGSRFTDINILQWQRNDFKLVGTYKPKIVDRESHDGKLILNESLCIWPNNKIPDDGKESCALEFIADLFSVECSSVNSVLIGTLCVFIILACSGFSFLFWKSIYAKKLEESAQIMINYGRVVNGIELSRWEIKRENVILNRRIGEGAFGTVYGGEALIDHDEGWSPVAIKTLKSNATAESRLDFLAESEIMKRFEHKNIVKLLAVCLQKEPLYMLTEFMLYGDLKTFLLARRHLVDDKIHDDTNDISPKRLTLMALDVARGLSYLASLNFVHRDIACRNCLINAQRICKIGDFGMARSTSDNDYYRFTRKGMLPVRWMSPEAVTAGLFTHSSDVWAFGVFLYEVVTLGGFPFQGLNNNQVFDLVKSGRSVKIPSNCKPQLKALMSSCFSIDPKKRPGASTVVEFISSHPRMLTPCMMDVPKPNLNEQVNLLGSNTDELEFDQLAERERSHTPAATINVDFLRTSASSSALPTQNCRGNQPEFEYLDMKPPRRINGIYNEYPDLTATLPNGNYNPIEPLLLQRRSEISKSTLSLLKMYVPMCGGKNRNRSPLEECTTSI